MNEFFGNILRVELGPELELQGRFLLDILTEDLLVEFEPGLVTLAVGVLQSKEPNLSQSNSFHHLTIKSLSNMELKYHHH